MTGDRRKFRREGEERRREALIAAALDLIAEGGVAAATVRAIADRAGVTPGLIRHYFAGKDDLTRAAFAEIMARMTAASLAHADEAPAGDPVARLAAFVRASLRPPVADEVSLGLWAGFIHLVRREPAMREIHCSSYLEYRDLLQGLIAAAQPPGTPPSRLRAQAIACNAVIDGLWLEGSVLPEAFEQAELEGIALAAVGRILGLELCSPKVPPCAMLP
jgi:AcrR family transcriptional regulator